MKKPLWILSYNNGNSFHCNGYLLKSNIKVFGGGNVIMIEKGVRLNKTDIVVSGNNNKLVIRKNVSFCEGGRIRIEDENNLIDIGEGTSLINTFLTVSDVNSKIIIGKESLFSANTIVRSSDSHSILNNEGKRINHAKDVIIGDRVWMGYGATILKGTIIGNDAVIGTHSVVTGIKVPDGCIVGGNPAKIIKSAVHWTKERLKE